MFADEWIESMREAAEDSLANPGELHAELAAERRETGRFFHDTLAGNVMRSVGSSFFRLLQRQLLANQWDLLKSISSSING